MTESARPQAWKISELSLMDLIKFDRRIPEDDCHDALNIAILGECATQHYSCCLSAALKIRGYWPNIYEAEFDTAQQELLDPNSGLNKSAPDFVIFFNTVQMLEERFHNHKHDEFVSRLAEETRDQWDLVLSRHKAAIIHHNYCLPLDITFGNHGSACERSFRNAVLRLNALLGEKAAEMGNVRIVDTEFQAAYYGKKDWLDEGLWCQAKQALSPRYLPALVKAVSDSILEGRGAGVKCVVLDLDNTMWGGILGDVGIDGIEIGEVNSIGRVFTRFQKSLLRLKERGILLTVCSKNEQANVDEVFARHPDMVIRAEDIVCSIANREDKVTNILSIQKALNIGLDSFVFLDDSPFERDFVRRSLPEVQVPELPEDPEAYLTALARWNLFENSRFSSEDAKRTSFYKADAGRKALAKSHHDLSGYLHSLEMVAEIDAFNSFSLPRVSQLIQRSNQFNLTTIRHSDAELANFAKEKERYVTFSIRLRDRLGDNGIVAIVIGEKKAAALIIDSWIMSCRVLDRRIEEATVSVIVDKAKKIGCDNIIGQYVATDKNSMVSNLYPSLGFSALDKTEKLRRFILDTGKYSPAANLPVKIEER